MSSFAQKYYYFISGIMVCTAGGFHKLALARYFDFLVTCACLGTSPSVLVCSFCSVLEEVSLGSPPSCLCHPAKVPNCRLDCLIPSSVWDQWCLLLDLGLS
jgi:hypothetical protein